MTWRNDDPREVYVDQSTTIVVFSSLVLTTAWVLTTPAATYGDKDNWQVYGEGVNVDADEEWPDSWWWCLPPDRGY